MERRANQLATVSGLPGAWTQLWPRRQASSAKCSDVPATRLKVRPDFFTSSHRSGASNPIRCGIGDR